jgi:hypothetical protein
MHETFKVLHPQVLVRTNSEVLTDLKSFKASHHLDHISQPMESFKLNEQSHAHHFVKL